MIPELCRKCGKELGYYKLIQWGPRAGKSFHFKYGCETCVSGPSIKRNSVIFDLVKDKSWKLSKGTKKHIIKDFPGGLAGFYSKPNYDEFSEIDESTVLTLLPQVP